MRKLWPVIKVTALGSSWDFGLLPAHRGKAIFRTLLFSGSFHVSAPLLFFPFTPDVSQAGFPICRQPCERRGDILSQSRKLLAQGLASGTPRRSSLFGKVQSEQVAPHSPFGETLVLFESDQDKHKLASLSEIPRPKSLRNGLGSC